MRPPISAWSLPLSAPADRDYLAARLAVAAARMIAPEPAAGEAHGDALAGRPIADYTSLDAARCAAAGAGVPGEGDSVPTRKATEAWFAWAMQHTAFFYVGAGDLMKSILTGKAENVYGIVRPPTTRSAAASASASRSRTWP